MPAYLIGQVKVKKEKLWQKYVDGVRQSLTPFDARIIFRGKRVAVLAGNHDFDLVVVITFADQATLDDWFYSTEYQSLIALRDEAAEVVITTYSAE